MLLKDLLFKYTTDASRFLVIDNMMIHYRDEGEGDVVLLLHGAFSSLHTFNDWNKQLKNTIV
jgi:pimeloyl-ACP methyl ester carboxylesterase